MMSKKNLVVVVVLVLAVLVVGIFSYKINHQNDYSVVYLTTGEIYVGKLSTFPDLRLKDSYILQVIKDTTDPAKSTFQLQPISEALWAPEYLNLNRKNIIFYGPLLSTSKIGQTLAGQVK